MYKIENEQDVQRLYYNFGNFHDCCIQKIEYISGTEIDENGSMIISGMPGTVSVIFQRQDKKRHTIMIRFNELIRLNLVPFRLYDGPIIDGITIAFDSGFIYFANEADFNPALSTEDDSQNITWLCCKTAEWYEIL